MNRTAILTSQPVVDGVPLYLVAPNVEVREAQSGESWVPVQGVTDEQWTLLLEGAPTAYRTRMVPVEVPPSPTMPCPECHGSNWLDLGPLSAEEDVEWIPCNCDDGTVPAPWLIAVQQCRAGTPDTTDGAPWSEWEPACDWPTDLPEIESWHERRQVVVAESPAPDVLPVLKGDPRSFDFPCVVLEQWGTFYLNGGEGDHEHLGNREPDQPDFQPWAANLKPGDTVWRFTPTLLNTPIVEMVTVLIRSQGQWWVGTCGPLSLVEGQPTVVDVESSSATRTRS